MQWLAQISNKLNHGEKVMETLWFKASFCHICIFVASPRPITCKHDQHWLKQYIDRQYIVTQYSGDTQHIGGQYKI